MNASRAPGTTRAPAIASAFSRANVCARTTPASVVAVGDPDPGKPEFGGARDHFLGMRGSAQKGKIRHRRQFGEPRLKPDQGRPLLCVRN